MTKVIQIPQKIYFTNIKAHIKENTFEKSKFGLSNFAYVKID